MGLQRSMCKVQVAFALVLALLVHDAACEPGTVRMFTPTTRSRRRYHEDAPSGCENTQQGRWYIADDQGIVCDRADLDYTSGCCSRGTQFTCQTCSSDDHCCTLYEHCVSCCLSPENKMHDVWAAALRATGRPDTGHWSTLFDFCRGKCRTSSNSTVHENDYVSARHYCYSENGRPLVAPLPSLPAEGVTLQRSAKGEDCDAACKRVGNLVCMADHFPHANNCNLLRLHLTCQAGCEVSEGLDQPSYVVPDAPKSHRPTMCFINDPATATFTCNGSHAHTERLCPCAPEAAKAAIDGN